MDCLRFSFYDYLPQVVYFEDEFRHNVVRNSLLLFVSDLR